MDVQISAIKFPDLDCQCVRRPPRYLDPLVHSAWCIVGLPGRPAVGCGCHASFWERNRQSCVRSPAAMRTPRAGLGSCQVCVFLGVSSFPVGLVLGGFGRFSRIVRGIKRRAYTIFHACPIYNPLCH